MPKKGLSLEAMLISREQWMIARTISGVVMAYNAPHCASFNEEPEVNKDPNYTTIVAAHVAEFCASDHMAIEDMIAMLQEALKVCATGRVIVDKHGNWST